MADGHWWLNYSLNFLHQESVSKMLITSKWKLQLFICFRVPDCQSSESVLFSITWKENVQNLSHKRSLTN
jgi:hypothetical protein